MLILCEKCFKYKLWFKMITSFGQCTCKQCAEKLHAKIDAKIKEAFLR